MLISISVILGILAAGDIVPADRVAKLGLTVDGSDDVFTPFAHAKKSDAVGV